MDTQTALAEFIREELAIGRTKPIQPDEDLISTGILDSLGVLRLVLFIEERFSIKMPDDEVVFDNFQNVATLAKFLERNKGEMNG